MLVWDIDEKDAEIRTVYAFIPELNEPYITDNGMKTIGYENAKEIETVKLTKQDISDGKGVGVDPKLIEIID